MNTPTDTSRQPIHPGWLRIMHWLNALAVVVLMMCIIMARLWYLQVAMGASFAVDADKQRSRPIRRLAARGAIKIGRAHV